jgi:hypothetical protein
LFINEIMTDNQNGTMDEFNQREDWVEIFNSGTVFNLAGCYVSDDPDSLDKWQIPATDPTATFMLPNSYKILWIDKDPEQGALHVDFSLSSDGEYFLLTAPDGITIIDSIQFGAQATDISYGRECDGCVNWGFFDTPTYNATNAADVQSDEFLFINEIQANNASTYHDLGFNFVPWLEVYNPNPYQVNMANYTFLVDGQEWLLPVNNPVRTVIPALGFGIFWFDGLPNTDTHHAPFVLPSGGATVQIKGPSGAIIDAVTYGNVATDKSYGRQTDGAPTNIVFNIPTPAVSNSTIAVSSPTLFINELLAANQTDTLDNVGQLEDWFEIYNPNNFDVNIGGYYISDNLENPMKWRVRTDVPDSTIVPAFGWLLLWADDDQGQGIRHTNFSLSNNGEYLGLYTPDGFTLIDEIAWSFINADHSYGRLTDGNTPWVDFLETTAEYSNNGATIEIGELVKDKLTVYPNPAAEVLRLSMPVKVQLFNVYGQIVLQSGRSNHVDVSGLSEGIYFLQAEGYETARVVISR